MEQHRLGHANQVDWFIGLIGALATIAVAGVMASGSERGTTNSALAVVLVVVAAGVLGGRRGGATTAIVGALSHDFFHTVPYNTLRIRGTGDIVEVALILAIGLVVGELAGHRHAAARTALHRRDELEEVLAHGQLLASTTSATARIAATCAAVCGHLGGTSARYEEGPVPNVGTRSRITSRGGVENLQFRALGNGIDLGDGDVQLEVVSGDQTFGCIVVTPTAGHAVSIDDRIAAVASGTQLALSLAHLPV